MNSPLNSPQSATVRGTCFHGVGHEGLIAPGHGFIVGDQVYVGPEMLRWERLKMLLTKPRVCVITKVDRMGFNFERRRMTWHEWFRELRGVFR